jgi:hypothetical protein
VSDLETLAREAGAAARAEARSRARAMEAPTTEAPRVTTRLAPLAVALGVLVVVAAVLLHQLAVTPQLHIDPVAPDRTESPPTGAADPTVEPTGPLPVACTSRCVATGLADGRVLVVGGRDTAGAPGAAVYDPDSSSFLAAGAPGADHRGGAAIRLLDGRVLLVGGASAAATVFDPVAGTFAALEVPGLEELGGTADGSLHVRGFVRADGRVLLVHRTGASLLDPGTGGLEPAGDLRTPRVRSSTMVAVPLEDGRILVAGGGPREVEVYDPDARRFSSAGRTGRLVDAYAAAPLHDGRVLLLGGTSEGWAASSAAELYDPASDALRPTGSMAASRFLHAAATLGDGRVLVVGGRDAPGAGPVAASAELYDPATGRFSAAPAPTTTRTAATAVPLADGGVLVLGDHAGGGSAWTADVYRPGARP